MSYKRACILTMLNGTDYKFSDTTSFSCPTRSPARLVITRLVTLSFPITFPMPLPRYLAPSLLRSFPGICWRLDCLRGIRIVENLGQKQIDWGRRVHGLGFDRMTVTAMMLVIRRHPPIRRVHVPLI